MPTYQLLTDRTLAQSSAITPTTLIHIVTTADTSQNVAGSSYKAELGQLVGLFSGSPDTNFANTDLTFTGNRTHDIGTSNYLYITNDPTFSTVSSFLYMDPSELQIGNFDILKPLYLNFSGNNANFISNNKDVLSVVNNVPSSEVIVNKDSNAGVFFTVKSFNDSNLISSDPVNDRVGIGTNAPSEKLEVSGNTKITGGLNIGIVGGTTPVTNLGIDINGNVVSGTTGGGTFTGGTVSGATTFTNGLTANTFSASSIFVNGVQITGDTFVTGGTFFVDTLTFTNNQGNNFQVTGITASGTTFTGGSGNCIADLYVTNIHGCSPITVYDQIQSSGSTSSGLLSFSFGLGNSATTDGSFAIGAGAIASGIASHAKGYLTNSSGIVSHAEGWGTYSQGDATHSEGFQTSAVTSYSHSEGSFSYALGSASHAEGNQTISSGSTSHAEGWNTIAGGVSSHAEGSGTTSIGISSHAEGFGTISIGNYSHTEGSFTRATNTGAHAEGSGTTASGTHSHAEGLLTSATTQGSHAEGILTLASDDGAHAEGYLTIASDVASHAEGSGTTASAFYSHSEGVGTIASGIASHSEGVGTIASGNYSHAEGRETKSVANYSHATGRSTIAGGEYQSVIGQWNVSGGTESAFIIGNGTSDLNRSNLLFAANSGVTVYGNFTSNTVSATTYYNLPPKEVFYKSDSLNKDVFGFLYESFCDGGTDPVYVSGIIPNDYSSMVSCDLITIPTFSGNVLTDIKLSYGQTGAIFSGNDISTQITYTYEIDEFTNLNVLPVFSSVTTNDTFSINIFQNDTRLYVLGLKMKYNRI